MQNNAYTLDVRTFSITSIVWYYNYTERNADIIDFSREDSIFFEPSNPRLDNEA